MNLTRQDITPPTYITFIFENKIHGGRRAADKKKQYILGHIYDMIPINDMIP
jgi:hypothetical protein